MKNVVMLFMLLSFNLMANDKGNGGCPVCQQSFDLALKTAVKLYDIGLEKVQKKVPAIKDLDSIYKVAEGRKVLPGKKDELNGRTLLSFVDTQTTKIDVKEYKNLDSYSKLGMELHELLVLMGIEKDGIYVWSSRLIELFPNLSLLKKRAENYSCSNGDQECIIHNPRVDSFLIMEEKSDLDGVCKYFGLKTKVNVNFFNKKYGYKFDGSGIDKNGNPFDKNYYKCLGSSCRFVKTITCEMN